MPTGSAARHRLMALLMHPIQYLVPLMRTLAAHPRVDLTVCFMSDLGLRSGVLKGYGEALKWDVPLLGGYRHKFLADHSRTTEAGHPLSRLNPSVVPELIRGRYDAVLLHGYRHATEWLALAAAKTTRTKVLFFGDVLLDSAGRMGKSTLASDAFRAGWCRSIDAALALSSQARRFYRRYGVPEDRVFWTPLAVDNAFWTKQADELRPRRRELKRDLGLDPELPVVLYVAHMRANKRPVDVVRALAKMRVPAALVMVGGGPLYDETARAVVDLGLQARVHLAGLQNQSALPRYYAVGDVFVLPSSPGEVTPLVVHEAMCSAMALVISDAVPSIIDFVREGENGFTYPCGETTALADRLDRALENGATTTRMGERSRHIVASWNCDVTVQGIVAALEATAR